MAVKTVVGCVERMNQLLSARGGRDPHRTVPVTMVMGGSQNLANDSVVSAGPRALRHFE